jgi:hypothetical protein
MPALTVAAALIAAMLTATVTTMAIAARTQAPLRPAHASSTQPAPSVAQASGGVLDSVTSVRDRDLVPDAAPPSRTPTPAAPAAAGAVRAVRLVPVGACSPGDQCVFRIEVSLQAAPSARDVAWAVELADQCWSGTRELRSGVVRAGRGWTLVIAVATVAIPADGSPLVEAVSHSPDQAASGFLALGPPRC